MPYTLNIGSIRCHILGDGISIADGGGFFGLVPRVLWERVIAPNERNMIPCEVRSLLVESDAGLVLVDVGYGDKYEEKQRNILGLNRTDRIEGELKKIGYSPADIDIVLLTHLHNDHAGGSTRWDTPGHTPGTPIPTYPNARYIVQRRELADASYPNERTKATYFPHNWQPLLDRKQLVVVDGPQRVASGLRTDTAPGHTPSVQSVWVEDKGESLLFLGDACSWAVQLERLPWVPAFDLDPMQTIETKRRLRQEAFEKNALLVFQHDSQVVAGRLGQDGKYWTVQPEIQEEAWVDTTCTEN